MNGTGAAKISRQILELAKCQFNEAEFVAGLREIRQTGGLKLRDFLQELAQEVTPRET